MSDPEQPLVAHIDSLWNVLTRHPREHPTRSSLLPLPNAYVVPGGRFGELYYWDSYFTMLGLAESGRADLLRCMADNFAYLIDTYGHVPNGNRSYYLSRSQPPVFALMVDLFETHGIGPALRYLPRLRPNMPSGWTARRPAPRRSAAPLRAHARWRPAQPLLGRPRAPREEMYLEDVVTTARSARDRRRRCTANCAPPRHRAGISVRAGATRR